MQTEPSTGISYSWNNKSLKTLPLLMLHGHGADHQAFEDITGSIYHPQIVVDLPGFGKSAQLKLHTVENIAEELKKFVKNLGVDEYGIIGHSFGTLVGLKLAEKDKNCKKLILLNPLPRFKPVMENIYNVFNKTLIKIPVPDKFSDVMLNSRAYKSAGYLLHSRQSKGVDYLNKLFYPPVVYADFTSRAWKESWLSIHEIDQFKLAANVKAKALIMHGDKDSLTTIASVELLREFFPDAKLVRFKKGGHIMHREITKPVVKMLNKFLNDELTQDVSVV